MAGTLISWEQIGRRRLRTKRPRMFRMKSDENGKEGLVPEEVLDTPGGGAAVLLAKASPGEPRFLLGKDTGGASWTM